MCCLAHIATLCTVRFTDVACHASEPILYGRLRAYAALGRSTTLAIEYFVTMNEAEHWLTAKLRG